MYINWTVTETKEKKKYVNLKVTKVANLKENKQTQFEGRTFQFSCTNK